MIATDIGRALLIGSIPVAYAFDALTFPHMLVVAFLMGTLTVLFHVSYSAFYPALVPRERLVEGGSIMHGSRALSYVAGPSIGGVLVQAISAPVTLVVDACSYVVSALFLRGPSTSRSRRPRRRGRVTSSRACAGSSATRSSGPRSARRRRSTSSTSSSPRSSSSTRRPSSTSRPATLGLVLGAAAVGGILGAVVTGRVTRWIGVGPAFALGCVLFPAPLLLVPLAAGAAAGRSSPASSSPSSAAGSA